MFATNSANIHEDDHHHHARTRSIDYVYIIPKSVIESFVKIKSLFHILHGILYYDNSALLIL